MIKIGPGKVTHHQPNEEFSMTWTYRFPLCEDVLTDIWVSVDVKSQMTNVSLQKASIPHKERHYRREQIVEDLLSKSLLITN